MMRHRYVAGPALIQGPGGIKVVHTPSCVCGWEAPKPYSSSEFARAAWTAHVDSQRGTDR